MTAPRLSVIVPSRAQPRQKEFLRRSIGSIRAQTAAQRFQISILIAVDAGEEVTPEFAVELGARCVASAGKSQAAALNAAIRQLDCEFVAILEDDDRWQPHFLEAAEEQLPWFDFISSNQVEFDEHGNLHNFFDFPTPSGWIMPLSTMRQVGEFNENYRFHLDNEWLGRLNRAGLRRVHLVDCHLPDDPELYKDQRSYLYELVETNGTQTQIVSHGYHVPLVQRFMHSGSGMAQIDQESANRLRSEQEYALLKQEFGKVPV